MITRSSRSHPNLTLFTSQFALNLMQVTFMFYYVKVFLNIFNVNEFWFNFAQLLFMFWNAINDPVFGYLQDVGGTWMKERAKIFTYFGPLMTMAFLLLWFPWGSKDSPPYVEGLHLIVALFLYDAFYSCVGVAWAALFTESTRDHKRRVRGIKYTQIATLLSINIVMITEKVSHSLDDFQAFQIICVVVGIISFVCFYIAGRLGQTQGGKLLEEDAEADLPAEIVYSWKQISVLTKELIFAQDFLRIVFTNFIHSCRSISHLNFASIATDILIPQSILAKGSWQLSAFFALCTLLPQILVISNERLLVRNSAYQMMCWSFLFSLFSSFLYIFSGNPYAIILFIVIDSVTVHSASPLFNLLLAEFAEDDIIRNKRKRALSSLIFSLNALIMKPASSIAPIIIVNILNHHGYQDYKRDNLRTSELKNCMLMIIFSIPALLSLAEFAVFRHYSLKTAHKGGLNALHT